MANLLHDHPSGLMVTKMIEAIFDSVNPRKAVSQQIRLSNDVLVVRNAPYLLSMYEKIHVIGFGKAVLSMALGVVEQFGEKIDGGLLITKHFDQEKQKLLPDTIQVLQGNHPVPADDTFGSTAQLVDYVKGITEKDLVLILISGGGSALCSLPVQGVQPEEMQNITRQLLACGADISEMNAIRKHLDQIKGGRLAELLWPADVITFVLSDVINSPLDVIASGPLVPDASTFQNVSSILHRYQLWDSIPVSIQKVVQEGSEELRDETPKKGARCFDHINIVLVADNRLACQTAVDFAREYGLDGYLMTTSLDGEAREVGKVLASLMEQICKHNTPFSAPVCLVFGGETTVTLHGTGKGGRNQELAMSAIQKLAGLDNVLLVTLATDGEDGPTDAAGAWVTGSTWKKSQDLDVSITNAMKNNDSHAMFHRLNQIVHTGPSGTNVNDVTLCFIF
jgi:hydroxypyruvate reductase